MKMNRQQLEAVRELGCDLLVTAGAGTGKTRVLTEKYLLLVEQEGLDPREIVAITFTQKAAYEMKTRVRQAMTERMLAAEGERRGYWQSRLEALESAYIGTFHGFCQALLREFPLVSGVVPNLRILSEGEEQILLAAAAERAATRAAREGTPDEKEAYWRMVIDHGIPFFLRQLKIFFPKLRESGRTLPDWARTTMENTVLGEAPVERLRSAVLDLLNYADRKRLTERTKAVLAEAETQLAELFPDPAEETAEAVRRLNRLQAMFPRTLGKSIREYLEGIHLAIDAVLEYFANKEFLWRIPVTVRFLNLLAEEYRRAKELQGALDFTDLQIKARDLLREHPEIRRLCQERYAYFMVDEFQDTNHLQLEFVRLLSRQERMERGRLFVVGDPKQSIYRFRGAQVEVVRQWAEELKVGNGRVLPLQENYRCHPVLIESINAICAPLFANGPIDYQPLVSGLTGEAGGEGSPRMHLLATAEEDRTQEAENLALFLRDVFAGTAFSTAEGGGKRPLRPGDVAILLRAMTHVGDYEAALHRWGIPYILSGGSGYYGLQEVQDQLSLIRLIRNSEDSLSLLALLRSPYAGLSDTDLYWLAQTKGGLLEAFYHLNTRPEQMEEAAWERMLRLRRVVKEFQVGRSFLTVAEMIRYALDELNYEETLCTLPYAERALANLEKLLRKADEFALTGGRYGLGDFLDYVGQLIGAEEREGEAQLETEGADAVRIMTVHAAKGLEFPMVVLAELERGFSHRDYASIMSHPDFGFAFKVPDGEGESLEPTLWRTIREQNMREEIAELKRLFYVALTRAKDYLVFSGVREDVEEIKEDRSWADWLRLRLPDNWQQQEQVTIGGQAVVIHHGVTDAAADISSELLTAGAEIAAASEVSVAPLPKREQLTPRMLRFSVTPLLDYLACPSYYYWRYRLGVVADQIEPDEISEGDTGGYGVLIGQLVHQLCAMKAPDKATVEEYITANLRWLPEEEWLALREIVGKMWETYRNSPYAAADGQVYSEYPFTVPLGANCFLHGIIDRLTVLGTEEINVVDFKTNRINRTDLPKIAAAYRPQLLTYSFAVQKMFGVLPVRAELFFLNTGQVWQEPITAEIMAKWETELIRAVEGLAMAREPQDFTPAQDCAACPKARWCGAKHILQLSM